MNMDTLCENVEPDVSFELFGRSFSAPIFVAPLGAVDMHYGPKYNDLSYNAELMRAAVDCGILAFTGDGINPDIMRDAVRESASAVGAVRESASAVGGLTIPTIKPWSREVVFDKLDGVIENNIFAAAMDVDGAGLPFLKKLGGKAGGKSVEEMREIIEHAGRPFIIKGIMTVAGAKKAVEAGAAGIVVSNHGGRVQGGVPSTAEVLGRGRVPRAGARRRRGAHRPSLRHDDVRRGRRRREGALRQARGRAQGYDDHVRRGLSQGHYPRQDQILKRIKRKDGLPRQAVFFHAFYAFFDQTSLI